jgi:hypothetical protein
MRQGRVRVIDLKEDVELSEKIRNTLQTSEYKAVPGRLDQ